MTRAAWLSHFRLKSAPFAKDVEDTELWLPSGRKSVVDDLVDAVQNREHVLLVGEPGDTVYQLKLISADEPDAAITVKFIDHPTF